MGGGYVSFEFAHVAHRAGARTIILDRGTPLRHFDQDLVQRLVRHTRELGVDTRLNATVTAIEQRGAGYLVRSEGAGRSGLLRRGECLQRDQPAEFHQQLHQYSWGGTSLRHADRSHPI